MSKFVRGTISEKQPIAGTDEVAGHQKLRELFPHGTVDHKAGVYVRVQLYTNNTEGIWSILKRGILGTYHNVNKNI